MNIIGVQSPENEDKAFEIKPGHYRVFLGYSDINLACLQQ